MSALMSSYNELVKEFENSQFWNFVGFEFMDIEEGKATIKIQLRDEILNMQKMLHGGIIMSGLDLVMGLCARTLGTKAVSTIQLEVRFLQSIYDGAAILKSELIHCTKNTAVLKGTVENLNGELVAFCTSTFKLVF